MLKLENQSIKFEVQRAAKQKFLIRRKLASNTLTDLNSFGTHSLIQCVIQI